MKNKHWSRSFCASVLLCNCATVLQQIQVVPWREEFCCCRRAGAADKAAQPIFSFTVEKCSEKKTSLCNSALQGIIQLSLSEKKDKQFQLSVILHHIHTHTSVSHNAQCRSRRSTPCQLAPTPASQTKQTSAQEKLSLSFAPSKHTAKTANRWL